MEVKENCARKIEGSTMPFDSCPNADYKKNAEKIIQHSVILLMVQKHTIVNNLPKSHNLALFIKCM